MLSIIIPAHNEETYLPACLAGLAAQTGLPTGHGIEALVAANGCADGTVAVAESARSALEGAGFAVEILDLEAPGKIGALNAGDARARNPARAYLDADVVASPPLLAELCALLDRPEAAYASGSVEIPTPESRVSRAYARVWTDLPFIREGVPGIGIYAVNAAGRARWGAFPDVISDDGFARLNFAPHERFRARATHRWPLPEGWENLVRVRRRWSEGNDELAESFPELMANDSQRNTGAGNALRLLRHPLSAPVYVAVTLAARRLAQTRDGSEKAGWRRGRA